MLNIGPSQHNGLSTSPDQVRNNSTMSYPGVIVVAEPSLVDLLVDSGAQWNVQERQSSVDAMWDNLSGGRLSDQSRVLVFSDSLAGGSELELRAAARAIVAMSSAGAHVFIAVWRSAELDQLRSFIDEAALAQGVAADSLVYHFLPVERGGHEVLELMRGVLMNDVVFPETLPNTVNRALTQQSTNHATTAETEVPILEIGGTPHQTAQQMTGASAELLARPPKPGQVTITVT